MKPFRKINRWKNAALRELKLQLLLLWCRYFNKKNDETDDLVNAKKVLLLRLDDKIGDMVVATGVIKKLADSGYQVSVLAGPACEDMLAGAQYIDKFYRYQHRASLHTLQKQHFDVVIDFDDVITYERCRLIYKLGAKHAIGFNKTDIPMYNTSINYLDAKKHITERHKKVLRLLGVDCEKYSYDLKSTQASINQVNAVLTGLSYDYLIAINPFTGSEDKDFSREQVVKIVNFIDSLEINAQIILIGQDVKVASLDINKCVYIPNSTVNTAVEIVRIVDLIISPDTSIVHMACAFNKRLVSIYNQRKLKDTGLPGYIIWSPNYNNGLQFVTNQKHVSDVPIEEITKIVGAQIEIMLETPTLQKIAL
jgi:ADP-heptose:LPS heptosyltransferase